MRSKATPIPGPLLMQVSELVARYTGLYFPDGRRNDLERGLRSALSDIGFDDVLSGIRWLLSAIPQRSQIENLARFLTVGETYFFRDKNCFDFLGEQVLPELISLRRSSGKYLRIWSAGCCSGEEPYSAAILLTRTLPDIEDWKISILGSDINPFFLKKASSATYSNWSFRDAPKWVKDGHFAAKGDNLFELFPDIRKRVTFVCHNLIEEDHSPLFGIAGVTDVIFCRNVLMYLTPAHQKQVVRKLRASLADGGWLIVSPSEVSTALFDGFDEVTFQGATFYRNSPKRARQKATARSADITVISGNPALPYEPPGGQLTASEGVVSRNTRKMGTPTQGKHGDDAQDLYDQVSSVYEAGLRSEAAERIASSPFGETRKRQGDCASVEDVCQSRRPFGSDDIV